MDPASATLFTVGGKAITPLVLAQVAGTAYSTFSQFQSGRQADTYSKADTRFQQQQIELELAREKTQQALDSRAREDRLKRALARQNAMFGGAVETGSGTPLRLQETSIGALNAEESMAEMASSQRIANLNLQSQQTAISGRASRSALRSRRNQSLFSGIGDIYDVYSSAKGV